MSGWLGCVVCDEGYAVTTIHMKSHRVVARLNGGSVDLLRNISDDHSPPSSYRQGKLTDLLYIDRQLIGEQPFTTLPDTTYTSQNEHSTCKHFFDQLCAAPLRISLASKYDTVLTFHDEYRAASVQDYEGAVTGVWDLLLNYYFNQVMETFEKVFRSDLSSAKAIIRRPAMTADGYFYPT
ncbi:uncharacterized protein P174DRAFT_416784 [Aspergillus novofumigatus IBT 16806]|uniref:Uncharacterized protein n=1 Tax=Aspergillus novofumigatus (strain IBT 16806) TaxID=1392255 RepID=A0A2I1CNB4_ASPN1|nr:uncharacterized protein P174DRAFT_416784 [Aspergillus novofumigatus IBT 16806]PKX99085.1 hypothetical protein P174DRAFT_416784 [Aspergillus novofumigatus IBT 16806]